MPGLASAPTSLSYLMNGCTVAFLHLIKLVYAADAFVGQHQGPALQNHLLSHRVPLHGCCETNPTGALAGGVDSSRRDVGNVLDQLALGHPWVTCTTKFLVENVLSWACTASNVQ